MFLPDTFSHRFQNRFATFWASGRPRHGQTFPRRRHTNKMIMTQAIVVAIGMIIFWIKEPARAGFSTRGVGAGQCPLMLTGVPTSIQS